MKTIKYTLPHSQTATRRRAPQGRPRPPERAGPGPAPGLVQWLAAGLGGLLLALFLALVVVIGFNLRYAERIFPGVSIAGIDLSGLRPEEAAQRLDERLVYTETGRIVFRDGEQVWIARPAELGLVMQPGLVAETAYQYGRRGNPVRRLYDQLAAWHSGRDLAPVLVFDKRLAQQYIVELARQVDRPTLEASLRINGLEVEVTPGQVGRTVDVAATLEPLEAQLRSLGDGMIPLVIQESPPVILNAAEQAELARRMISAPLTLQLPQADAPGVPGASGPWVLPPDQVAGMLAIAPVQTPEGSQYQVALDEQKLYDYLTGLSTDINRGSENARFMFNDETRLLEVIKPAVIGRNLDVYTSLKRINAILQAGEHTVPLDVRYMPPEVTDDMTGAQLGITEQIIAYTSYFRGSTTERLQNIETAAANFHGLLIPPGAVFSMAEVMGSVSLDTGYAEAWIIYGGRTIKGVGGGVCQVSTTLFRAAFFAGFPIIERNPHAYRVGYYEQTRTGSDENLAGLDATVFVPTVDFKFQNDTPYWLLMETYYYPNSRSLTWKFYSTSDGRRVEWTTSGPQNLVEPEGPVFEENPEMAEGQIKQVDWEAVGADVTVTRTVYRGDQILYRDVFNTHYLPWRAVYQIGPGTEIPKKLLQRR